MWVNYGTEFDIGQDILIFGKDEEYEIIGCELAIHFERGPEVFYLVKNNKETIRIKEGEIFHARTTLP